MYTKKIRHTKKCTQRKLGTQRKLCNKENYNYAHKENNYAFK